MLAENSGLGQVAVVNVYGPTAPWASGVPQQVNHSADPDPYRQSRIGLIPYSQSSASKCKRRLLAKRPPGHLGQAEAAESRESAGREREKGNEEGEDSPNNGE